MLNCSDLLEIERDFPRSSLEDYTQWQNHDMSCTTVTHEYTDKQQVKNIYKFNGTTCMRQP